MFAALLCGAPAPREAHRLLPGNASLLLPGNASQLPGACPTAADVQATDRAQRWAVWDAAQDSGGSPCVLNQAEGECGDEKAPCYVRVLTKAAEETAKREAAPHEWADLLGGGHGCGAMGVAPWCGANANYTSHADFRLGYYLGAWAAAASGSINVSGMSTEARIDRPFLYKSCPRSSCGAVPERDACVHYAEDFAELLRDVGMGDDCIRLPVMWGDRSTSMAGAADTLHASKATMWAGDPMTVPTLAKSRLRDARVPGILLKLNPGRHWGFLSETPPLSARLSWAERKDALIWRGTSATGRCAGCTNVRQRFVDELAGRTHEGIDVAFGEDSHMMGEDSHRMSEDDMGQYRYTLSLEGNDVATDLKWKLASGMVVLMPTPTTESWLMEFALQPGVHYVAVETPADVPVKLAELRARPEEAERISGAARAWMAPFADVEEEAKLQREVLRKVVALVGGEEPRHEQHEQAAATQMVAARPARNNGAAVLPAGPEPARRPGSFNWVSTTSAGSSVSVQVQLIAMEQEHTSPRFLDTVKVFDHWGVPYANYTPTPGDNALAVQGVQFIEGLSPAQRGCWTSHASWWLRAAAEGAVITVESDTDPLEAIHELPLERFGGWDALMSWDLIALHDTTAGQPTGGNCEATSPPVADGPGYFAGAYLATGRRELTPQLLMAPECSQDGKIAFPVDHWLNCMHEKQLLSIGHACPSVFHQRLGGTHAEQSADDSKIEHTDAQS